MKNISEEWIKSKLRYIEKFTENYSYQEKGNIQIEYLAKLLNRIPELETSNHSNIELIEKIDTVVNSLPEKTKGVTLNYGNYSNNIENLKTYIKEKYNFVSGGYYKRICFFYAMALGPSLGLPFGVAISNIGLGILIGICLGLPIGVAFGTYLDKKAKEENRVL
jgi:hypothetical protein